MGRISDLEIQIEDLDWFAIVCERKKYYEVQKLGK